MDDRDQTVGTDGAARIPLQRSLMRVCARETPRAVGPLRGRMIGGGVRPEPWHRKTDGLRARMRWRSVDPSVLMDRRVRACMHACGCMDGYACADETMDELGCLCMDE